MRSRSHTTPDFLARQAKLYDEKAERAEVRRVRAVKLGNRREAEGAMKTIEDARTSARLIREKLG